MIPAPAADGVELSSPDPSGGARRRKAKKSRSFAGPLFVLPAVLVVAVFLAYPVFATINWSFQDWADPGDEHRWVGLSNYANMTVLNPYFGMALKNTLIWAAATVPLQLGVGLAMALALDRALRGRTFYRTVFFLPAIFSSVVIAFVWNAIYSPEHGMATQVIQMFGGDGQGWLSDPTAALPSVMVVSIWRYAGFSMLFYLAAMQSIPVDLYEAAEVDGAGWWRRTWYITLPMLKPMTALLVLFGLIGSLREFEIVWIMTAGGPAHVTDLLSIQVYTQAFLNSQPGIASAVATVLLAIVVIASAVMLLIIRRVQASTR